MKNQKGGNFLNNIGSSVFQNTKKKNYTVRLPGSDLFKSSKTSQSYQPKLSIIFNYHVPNEEQYDITTISPHNPISSKYTSREPHIIITDNSKYLIVLYREIKNKKNPTPKLLLHFLIGFINNVHTKLFSYIEPIIKIGKKQKFVVKMYKYPITDTSKDFIKIHNINKKKAFEELSSYLINNRLQLVNTFVYVVKGEPNQGGLNLFSLIKHK